MKTSYILLFVSTFLVFSGCESYLEEDPFSAIDPGTLFQNEQGALAAVNATYKILSRNQDSYGRDLLHVLEQPTETITTRRDASDDRGRMDNWLWDKSHGFLAPIWTEAYAGINSANGVIENVPLIQEIDPVLQERIVGEAKFLRALNYFMLVRLWGGVPIREQQIKGVSEVLELPRSSATDVYQLIIRDLMDAEAVLPTREGYDAFEGANTGRATRGAARALLAKVYLQKGATPAVSEGNDFAESLNYANLVVNEENYVLVEDYRSIFDINTENSDEVIFDIQQTSVENLGGDLSGHVVPRGSGLGRRSWGNFHAEVPFFSNYATDDQRTESFILEYDTVVYDVDNFEEDGYVLDGPGFFKLAELDPSIGANAQERPNKVLLRYADVLLMAAEAANEVNNGPTAEAYNYINQVRQRAGIPDLTPGLNYAQFRDSLFTDRRKELIFEYHGWFDGLRFWDLFTNRVLANVQTREAKILAEEWPDGNTAAPRFFTSENIKADKYRLFPIPQDIIDVNSQLEQNPGWE